MAVGIDVTCHSCGKVSEQMDGPFFAGFSPRCIQCGATTFIALDDLGEDGWNLARDRIPELAGRCECGGTFNETAPIRCPYCRSTNVTTTHNGLCAD